MSEPSITTTHSTPRPTNLFRVASLAFLALLALTTGQAEAAREYRRVVVADPYLEMHTGPGRGYPVFHVVDRGESVDIVKQRTDWFLVRDADGDEGWVNQSQMEQLAALGGSPTGGPGAWGGSWEDEMRRMGAEIGISFD